MSRYIIERYVYDALNARATLASDELASDNDEPRRELARGILRDIDVYFADNMDDVLDARSRLARRDDPDAAAMLAFVDETLANYADAEKVAQDAIARARGG